MRNWTIVLGCMLAACVWTVGCEFEGGENEGSYSDSTNTDSNNNGNTDNSGAPQLTSSHPGYRDPCCWDCHDPADTHNVGLDPYQCAGCHGGNGAPSYHGETECQECHSPNTHTCGSSGQDFPMPDACAACHITGSSGGGGDDEGDDD